MADVAAGAKRIVPSRFQDPPSPLSASQTVRIAPPAASTRFSFPSAKKPIERLSGDQKGKKALSAPATGCAAAESSSRSHKDGDMPTFPAVKARRLPSGDSAIS